MQLVFARGEVNRREVFRGHFAIHGHRKSGDDKWASGNMGAAFVPRFFCYHTNRDTKVPPTFLFGFTDLVFQSDHFLFHLAQSDVLNRSTRFVKQINHSAWKAAKKNNEKT